MEKIKFIIICATVVAALATIIASMLIINHQRKKGAKKLFTGEGAIARTTAPSLIIPEKSEIEKRIEEIIKNSERISSLVSNANLQMHEWRSLFENEEIVDQIKNAKTNEDAENLLVTWLQEKNPPSSKELPQHKKRKIKHPRKKMTRTKNRKQKTIIATLQSAQQISLTSEEQKKSQQLQTMIDSNMLKEFIELVRTISDDEIKRILEYWRQIEQQTPFTNNLMKEIVRRARTKQDITRILKEGLIENLELMLQDVKQKISFATRKGLDTKNESLTIINVPQKIKMFRATMEQKDFEKVREMLKKLDFEIEQKIATLKQK